MRMVGVVEGAPWVVLVSADAAAVGAAS